MAKEEPAPQAPAPKKKSRKLLVAVIGLVLLGGGGAGAYFTFRPKAAGAAAAHKDPPAIVSLDPFVVNLADPGKDRFLRVTLGLVVSDEDGVEAYDEDPVARMRVRSAILELLAQQTASQLVTREGKASLKKVIAARASAESEHLKVTDVLFSEFIVQ